MRYLKLILTTFFILFFGMPALAGSLEAVSLQLKWKYAFQFAGYIAAKEKGFYAEEGLDVTLFEHGTLPGSKHPSSAYDLVARGYVDFGVGDIGIVHNHIGGAPLVWLTQIFQHSPQVFITLKSSDIRDPVDMIGKKVSLDKGSVTSAPLEMMLRDVLGDYGKKIHLSRLSSNYYKLIDGRLDVIGGYITDQPYWFKQQGYDVNIISPQNYGYDFYGDNLFTSQKFLKEHPQLVEKMVRASLKGWKYALKNKEEIIDIIQKRYNSQNLTRDHLAYEAKITDQLIMPELVPLGSIDRKRLLKIMQAYKKLGLTDTVQVHEDLIYSYGASSIQLTQRERKWLRQHQTIYLSAPKGTPPMFSWQEDGQPRGVVPDFINSLERIIGEGVKLRVVRSKKYLDILDDHKIYGAAPIMQGENAEPSDGLKATAPFSDLVMNVYVRGNARLSCHCKQDLIGKRIGVLDEDEIARKYVSDISGSEIKIFSSARRLLAKLQSGELDAVVGYSTYDYLIHRYDLIDIKLAFSLDGKYDVSIGVKPEHKILLGILNKAIAELSPLARQRILSAWTKDENQVQLSTLFTPEEQNWLAKRHKIRVRVPNWPPYMVNSHVLSGLSVEYLKAVADFAGLNVQFKGSNTHWVAAKEDVQKTNKDYDFLLVMAPTEERQKKFAFTQPYLAVPIVIIAKKERTDIRNLSDLSGESVSIEAGYSHIDLIREANPAIKIHTKKTTLEALQSVATGQDDAYIGNLVVANYFIRSNGFASLEVVGTTPFGDELLSMSMRKDWAPLASIIDKSLQALPPEKLLHIRQKWMGGLSSATSVERSAALHFTEAEKSYLKSKTEVKICANPSFLPFEHISSAGHHEGIFADYMDIFSRKMGVPFRLIPTQNYSQSLQYLQAGNCDVATGELLPEQAANGLLATMPFMTSPRVFSIHTNHPIVSDFTVLAGGRIGALKNSSAMHHLEKVYPNANPVPVDTIVKGLRKVATGELDAFVSPLASASYGIKTQRLNSVKIGGVVAKDIPFAVLVNPRERQLVPILNKTIRAISQQERKIVQNKWLSVVYERGTNYVLLWQIVGGVLLVAFLIAWRIHSVRKISAELSQAQKLLVEKEEVIRRLALSNHNESA